MIDIKKFLEIDLYGLIGIDITANAAEIRKAYRKKALSCHPDKNPDNPKAAELFQQLSKALEVLTDESARSAYDKILNARKAAELRNLQLDSKRQKLKKDLEAREKLATGTHSKSGSSGYSASRTPEEIFQDEIERLRNEGSRLLEEEQELMRKQLLEEKQKAANYWDSSQHRIKIKWTAAKDDKTNGGYNTENLTKFLNKYGDIVALVISAKKNGSALVEFNSRDASEMAIAYEKGNLDNPLKLEWISDNLNKINTPSKSTSATIKETDFESLVLRQLRQAEERKRLIEQMMKDEDE